MTESIIANPNKPFTAQFELDTKIRLIIQDVLAATIKKLGMFNEKVDKFEEYFVIFKEKIGYIEKNGNDNQQNIERSNSDILKLRSEMGQQMVKINSNQEKSSIENGELREQVRELNKLVRQLKLQNENFNNDLTKTKTKFIQYSDSINAMKQEVAYKISKYVQETAQVNTQIKINNQAMKRQNFGIMLSLDKQKEKYQEVLLIAEESKNQWKKADAQIQELHRNNLDSAQELKNFKNKADMVEASLYSRIKQVEVRCEGEIEKIKSNTEQILGCAKKVDEFGVLLEGVVQDQQINQNNLLRKIEETTKRGLENTQTQIIKVNKEIVKVGKDAQKRNLEISEKVVKLQLSINKQIDLLKEQIENQIATKARIMLEEKHKGQQVMSMSAMQDVDSRMNLLEIEISKSIEKVNNKINEVKTQVRKEINFIVESMEKQVKKHDEIKEQNLLSGKIEPQNQKEVAEMQEKIMKKIQILEQKVEENKTEIGKDADQIKENFRLNAKSQEAIVVVNKRIDTLTEEWEAAINNKLEKTMFLVTKLRGDEIIRQQFTDREIKEVRARQHEERGYRETFLKLLPGLGECVNIIMALIFDAEYYHSKLIQDNLPNLPKDMQKFSSCTDGMLYEFKEKKKPGNIYYRHSDFRKIDIIKGTFKAFIQLWDDLYEQGLHHDPKLAPKGFFKLNVQKAMNKTDKEKPDKRNQQPIGSMHNQSYDSNNNSPVTRNRRASTIFADNNQQNNVADNRQGQLNTNTAELQGTRTNTDQVSSTFQIRKKKNLTLKSKEQNIAVVSQQRMESQ